MVEKQLRHKVNAIYSYISSIQSRLFSKFINTSIVKTDKSDGQLNYIQQLTPLNKIF